MSDFIAKYSYCRQVSIKKRSITTVDGNYYFEDWNKILKSSIYTGLQVSTSYLV